MHPMVASISNLNPTPSKKRKRKIIPKQTVLIDDIILANEFLMVIQVENLITILVDKLCIHDCPYNFLVNICIVTIKYNI